MAAVRTYRYLRLGMVIIVITHAGVAGHPAADTGCWQGSISAYFYSPSRAIFVSGMVAIGVSLVVIKGSTIVEDVLLNLAGMLAPIVALVPTTFEARCVHGESIPPGPRTLSRPPSTASRTTWKALLLAGGAALVIALISLLVDQRSQNRSRPGAPVLLLVLLLGAGVIVGLAWWALTSDEILKLARARRGAHVPRPGARLHLERRVAVAPEHPPRHEGRPPTCTGSSWRGRTWGSASGCSPPASSSGACLPDPWDYDTSLVLEMIEIGLFASMWLVQTVERWGKILQAGP